MTEMQKLKINEYKERCKSEYGTVVFEGEIYILTEQAFLSGGNPDPYYEAPAIKDSDITDENGEQYTYTVIWYVPDSTLDYWDNGGEDEDDACDWQNPDNVTCDHMTNDEIWDIFTDYKEINIKPHTIEQLEKNDG